MTVENTEKILTLLQAEYPHSFSGLDERMMLLKRNLWCKEFENDPFEIVYAAVRMCIRSGSAFAPGIGEIRQKMAVLTEDGQELPEQMAWALVSKACANGLHHSKEEFAALPEEVQRAVGGPEQLRLWAAMDAETVQSVVASNFMRAFRTQKTREKELALLPPEVRQMLGGVIGGVKMIEGGGKDEDTL